MTDMKEGQWAVIRGWGLEVRQLAKITPKLVKFNRGMGAGQADHSAVLFADDEQAVVERMRDTIAGVDGEYARRCQKARAECARRVRSAEDARDQQIARAIDRASMAEASR